MIKTTKYSNTSGNEKFKIFLNKKFNFNMLNPTSTDHLFDGWMINGTSGYTTEECSVEIFSTYYSIKKNISVDDITYLLSIPNTIDDFINDMDRFNIQLYWNNKIDLIFEPKDYLHVDNIKDYYVNLLSKINKSHELI